MDMCGSTGCMSLKDRGSRAASQQQAASCCLFRRLRELLVRHCKQWLIGKLTKG